MLTLEFQELKDHHNVHNIVAIEDYNIYQLHQWHNQVQEWGQMVVAHEAEICLAHGRAELDQVHNHMQVVVVVHQGVAARYTCCITRKI